MGSEKIIERKRAFGSTFNSYCIALLTALLVWGITLTFDALEHKQALRDQHFAALENASLLSKKLESSMATASSFAQAIAAMYATGPDFSVYDFSVLASQSAAKDAGIYNLDLFRDTLLISSYPESHKESYGLDIKNSYELWPIYREMMSTHRPVIAGPIKQTGQAPFLVVYAPVYRNQATEKHFIGAVSTRIPFEQLLHDAGIADIERHLVIAIRSQDHESLYGRPELFDSEHVSQIVNLSIGKWEIAARPKKGWTVDTPLLGWWGGLLCLLGGMFAYYFSRHMQYGQEKQRELNESQQKLTQNSIELVHHNTVLEMIARHAPLPDILMLLTKMIEMHDPAMLCAIMIANQDRSHLQHAAATSLPESFCRYFDGTPIKEGMSTCGTAAFRGERMIIDNIATHPYWKNARAIAQQAGIASCWAHPIKNYAGEILGVFAIYHRESTTPNANQLSIIESYTSLTALAIESHHNAETLYLHNAALNAAADAIVIADLNTRIIWTNQAFTRLTGYTQEEMLGHRCGALLQTAQEDPQYYEILQQTVLSGRVWQGELVNQRKDGTYYHDEMSITPIRNQAGDITHFVALKRDITARKNSEEQLRNLAFYDPLTKLPNRRLLIDRLGQAIIVSRRSGHYGALMFLDLDNFKPLNDLRGHDVGDLLLIEAAQRITACVRAQDTVARFGGDEFVVVLENLSEDKENSEIYANGIAEKIRAALGEPYFLEALGTESNEKVIEHYCTSSIGITLFSSTDNDRKTILKYADIAMYKAKAGGRDRICFYECVS